MAALAAVSRLSPVNFETHNSKIEGKYDNDHKNEQLGFEGIVSGAMTSEHRAFSGRRGGELSVTPLIVDFRRILQNKSKTEVVSGVSNTDLLHAVVGLYSTSLSEMTPDVLYTSVCEKWARTIVLLRDLKETTEEYNKKDKRNKTSSAAEDDDTDSSKNNERQVPENDIYEPEESCPGTFFGIFSDTEDEEKEESDSDDEEEDFSRGIHAFLQTVKSRQKARRDHAGPLSSDQLGIENRIVGAATYEKTYLKPKERLVHLTLIAVRQRYRKWGLGKYLLSQVKDMSIVGSYDAVVVHADSSAIEFFQRYGFTDDVVLNSRYSEIAEQYTQCTLMCYLPPFTSQSITHQSAPEVDIVAMDREITAWREKSIEAYKAEVSCVNRLRHEIIGLRALVSSQQDLIATMASENDTLRREKFTTEKQFMEFRLAAGKAALADDGLGDDEDDVMESFNPEHLIKEMEAHLNLSRSKLASLATAKMVRTQDGEETRQYMVTRQSDEMPYNHGEDTEKFYGVTQDFYKAMRADKSLQGDYQVKTVSKTLLCHSVVEAYQSRVSRLGDPHMVAKMYLCGLLERANRAEVIMHEGFSEEDFCCGDFGRGLYFSKYPSKAAQFSPLGKLLVVEVALGTTETVLRKERTRTEPSHGYDSIITPGRLRCDGDSDNMMCQEYVVFNVNQVLPLYLIEYVTGSPVEAPQDMESLG